ncbi:hypothetical protein R70211_01312 [Paraburkholderia domus]|uniref:Uncharacterized protein n=2 Tax=Paraburkholderia domus TaxID=2793075 RepID=A0A9N8MMF9_9BURK|nr:hypothetical protein R70211_01312 [Paraburkholderia domus]
MCTDLSGTASDADHVEAICLILFDDWCATRSVIPLVYLMQCWPLLDYEDGRLRRLTATLAELLQHHADALVPDHISLVCELVERVKRMLGHLAPQERIRSAA